MTVTFALGACHRGAPPSVGTTPAAPNPTLSIRFDNDARQYVHVYLIGTKREWLLGRVESGAVTMLRIPEEALAADAGFVQLAVLTGTRMSMQVARDPRTQLAVAQPASSLLLQQWKFVQGQLMPRRIDAVR